MGRKKNLDEVYTRSPAIVCYQQIINGGSILKLPHLHHLYNVATRNLHCREVLHFNQLCDKTGVLVLVINKRS